METLAEESAKALSQAILSDLIEPQPAVNFGRGLDFERQVDEVAAQLRAGAQP